MAKVLTAKNPVPKAETTKGVVKAKEELAQFREALGEAENWMRENKEPFCRACFWEEYERRASLAEFNASKGVDYESPEVPDWKDYAGEEKFFKGKPKERKIRREGIISVEQNYECKQNRKHGVCLMDEKPYIAPGTPLYDKTVDLYKGDEASEEKSKK